MTENPTGLCFTRSTLTCRPPFFLCFTLVVQNFTIIIFFFTISPLPQSSLNSASQHSWRSIKIASSEASPHLPQGLSPWDNPLLLTPLQAPRGLSHRQDSVISIFNYCTCVAVNQIVSPKKLMLKSQPLVPLNVALLGNRIFADIIKLR